MRDRTSKYPGRVRLTPVEGQPNVYDREWADEPQQLGTPLNKESLLSDVVAAALRLTQADPTVSDAFAGIVQGFAQVTVSDKEPTAADVGYPGHLWFVTADADTYIYRLRICLGSGSGQYIWRNLLSVKKSLRTKVFTSSTMWTVPDNLIGDIRAVVFGGGGSGSVRTSGETGGGGGGGRMAEWIGHLDVGTSVPVTIGTGGAKTSASTGKSGGSSSFGAFASATGGDGGRYDSGGDGGSGGGGGKSTTSTNPGVGEQFGSGGSIDTDNRQQASDGIDTTSLDIDNQGKGPGKAGVNSAYGAGGGGGFGGNGGNGGSSDSSGGGGGGGFGSSGNGGDGGGNDGGIAAGGGGNAGSGNTSGAGGDGVVMITYYVMEATS